MEGEYLRKNAAFRIIPMLNVDGVIFGNYRSSLIGKDLNRKYKSQDADLYPEVAASKTLVMETLEEGKLFCFLDLHGHSS